MASYTLSDCVLNNLELDKVYITDVLMVFAQQNNPYKVSLDRTDVVLSIYSNIAEGNEIVATWLSLMTMKPSSFEVINVDASGIGEKEEIFLKLCASTKGQQKLIVNSHQSCQKHVYINKNIIYYGGANIVVYDRDEAKIELSTHSKSSDTYINSQVARDNSSISGSQNT